MTRLPGWLIDRNDKPPTMHGSRAQRRLAVTSGKLARVTDRNQRADPRASDEALAVTIPLYAHLGTMDHGLPWVRGDDDANRADWIRAATYEHLTTTLVQVYGSGPGRRKPARKTRTIPARKSETKRLNREQKAAARMQNRKIRPGDKGALKTSNARIREIHDALKAIG